MKKKHLVLGLGEILWDILPGGKKLGGAPANFCYHASCLGADSYMLSGVGDDILGAEILKKLDGLGLRKDYIRVYSGHPTGTVDVVLDDMGIPSYRIHENTAWDNVIFEDGHKNLALAADAICFGTLGQRSKVTGDTIKRILDISPKDALRVFDINIRQNFYSKEIIGESLNYCNVLKINEEELTLLTGLLGISGGKRREILNRILKDYDLNLIVLTLGREGSILATPDYISQRDIYDLPVKDTVGAGDAFTAAVVTGLLKNMDIDEINRRASILAGYVCSMEGGTPPYTVEMINLFK